MYPSTKLLSFQMGEGCDHCSYRLNKDDVKTYLQTKHTHRHIDKHKERHTDTRTPDTLPSFLFNSVYPKNGSSWQWINAKYQFYFKYPTPLLEKVPDNDFVLHRVAFKCTKPYSCSCLAIPPVRLRPCYLSYRYNQVFLGLPCFL